MSAVTRRKAVEQLQIDAFRRMTPGQRVECALRLTHLTCELARSAIRQEHPDWTGPEVDRELGRRITGIDVTTLEWERVRRPTEDFGRDEASSNDGQD